MAWVLGGFVPRLGAGGPGAQGSAGGAARLQEMPED